MKITQQEVERVAQLARLHLSNQELETMTGQLDTILSYVDKLDELDTSGIQPTTHAFFLCNALRDDKVIPSLPQAEALANSPCHNGDSFIVPRVL
jgi:aspartyl-tRNA(Asn)/glutamyl-tRNA(Gln) amidotransferase subunit C